MKKPRPKLVERSTTERAAIAVCRSVYHGQCACDKAPTVCATMMLAARCAIGIADPALAQRLSQEDIEHAAEKRP